MTTCVMAWAIALGCLYLAANIAFFIRAIYYFMDNLEGGKINLNWLISAVLFLPGALVAFLMIWLGVAGVALWRRLDRPIFKGADWRHVFRIKQSKPPRGSE